MKWKILQNYINQKLNRVRYCRIHQKSMAKWRWCKIKVKKKKPENKSFHYLVQWNQALFLLDLVEFPQLLSGSYIIVGIVLWDFAPVLRKVNHIKKNYSYQSLVDVRWTEQQRQQWRDLEGRGEDRKQSNSTLNSDDLIDFNLKWYYWEIKVHILR